MTAKYYVTCTDKFMSGWGVAKGKTNKLVFPCDTHEEACIVADNAKARTDTRYVNICIRKPYYPADRYLVQVKTREEYDSWYKPGYFRNR